MKSKKGFGSRPKGGCSPDQVFISAGEASGDLHGSMFMRELRALVPGIGFVGMGGAAMEAMGLKKLVDMKHVSVVGITEVLGRLMGILRAQRILKAVLINTRPRLMVLIDFPDFHMSLLGLKEKIGCRILYLIPPQVWAWRAGRIKRLKRYVDSLAVILPFEEEYYRSRGLKAEYIGNPLVELYPEPFLGKRDGRIVGILPGSRVHEVKRNLPVIYEALLLVKERL
ncbi:MAG: lipid-A-disaccharide synthase, partial [Desulfatiglandales bacterium]